MVLHCLAFVSPFVRENHRMVDTVGVGGVIG